jgi:hypothetical protein
MGVGPGGSAIKIDHATANCIEYTATSQAEAQLLEGLTLSSAQANTGFLVHLNAAARVLARNCYIGNSNNFGGTGIYQTVNNSVITALNCVFQMGANTGGPMSGLDGHRRAIACRFISNAGARAAAMFGGSNQSSIVAFNYFDMSPMTSGTVSIVNPAAGAPNESIVVGNKFVNPTGGTVTAIEFGTGIGQIMEAANIFGSSYTPFKFPTANEGMTGATTTRRGTSLLSRDAAEYYISTDNTPLTIEAVQYGTAGIKRTSSANQTLTIDDPPYPGAAFTLAYHNNNAGAIATVTVNTHSGNGVKGLATFGINATSVSYYWLRAQNANGKLVWALAGSLVNQTPP